MAALSFRDETRFGISSFPAAVLRGIPYQNNSNVTLEDIGEDDDALLCITNLTACCRSDNTGGNVSGNWFFPNGTRVPSSVKNWDFHRSRGQMVVRMNRRRGGVEGIYRCEILDAMNVTQTIYIGVYSASTGEWSILFWSECSAYVAKGARDSSMIIYCKLDVYISSVHTLHSRRNRGGTRGTCPPLVRICLLVPPLQSLWYDDLFDYTLSLKHVQ